MGTLVQFVSLFAFLLPVALCANYHGYKVVRVIPKNGAELDILNNYLAHTPLQVNLMIFLRYDLLHINTIHVI